MLLVSGKNFTIDKMLWHTLSVLKKLFKWLASRLFIQYANDVAGTIIRKLVSYQGDINNID